FCGQRVTADSSQVFASLLFADISGFTQLSSRLSAEELKTHINEYFTGLLGVIHENAGDVIKFCGDAVMIMWAVPLSATAEVRAAAVLMSALCALQLIEEYVSLSLHCGISCGPCNCMILGDGNRLEFIISDVSLSLHCGISCGPCNCMILGDGNRLEFIIS
ncbi:nucleotide cyclase, partial [Ochromonadaceae sp. CCMP2298]